MLEQGNHSWVSKNMESISTELRTIAEGSEVHILHTVPIDPNSTSGLNGTLDGTSSTSTNMVPKTPSKSTGGGGGNKVRGMSIGLQFRQSLQKLNAELSRCDPHYIRCVHINQIPCNVFI